MASTVINFVKILIAEASIALLVLFAFVGISPAYATDAIPFNADTEVLSASDFPSDASGVVEEVLPVYQGADAVSSTEVLPVYQGAEAVSSVEVLPVYQYARDAQAAA